MKLRTLFVSNRKQVTIPEGWDIYDQQVITPPKGKPQYVVLLRKKTEEKPKRIGFKTR